MAKDQKQPEATQERTVPVVNDAGEQLGTFKGAELPATGSEWTKEPEREGDAMSVFVVQSADDKGVVVKPRDGAKNEAMQAENARKAEVVELSPDTQLELVTAAGVLPLHDPFQNITFSGEPKPTKATPWVKTQYEAGLLREAVAEDFSDEDARKSFVERGGSKAPARDKNSLNGVVDTRSQGRTKV